MYNGVGLQTPRGSGTSGYIQTNKSYIRQKSRLPQNDRELLAPPKPKKANRAILEHDRQRQIELQLTIYREQLESRNYSEKEIEKKVAEKRKEVMMAVDSQKLTRNDLNDTHSVAKAKEEESERLARAFKIDRGYVEGAAFKQMEDKRGGAPGSGAPLTGGKKKDDAPKMPEKWLAAGAHDQIPNPRGTRDRREVEVDGEDRRVEETRYERDERRRDTDRRDRDRGRDRSRDRSSGRSSSRRDRSRDRSRSRSRERGTDRFSDRYRPRDRSASRERGRDREGARRSRSRTRSPARKEGEPPKRKGLVDAGSSDSEDTAKAPAAPPAEGKSSDVSSKENRKASGKDTAKKSKRRSRSPSSSSSSSSSSSGSDSSSSDSDSD